MTTRLYPIVMAAPHSHNGWSATVNGYGELIFSQETTTKDTTTNKDVTTTKTWTGRCLHKEKAPGSTVATIYNRDGSWTSRTLDELPDFKMIFQPIGHQVQQISVGVGVAVALYAGGILLPRHFKDMFAVDGAINLGQQGIQLPTSNSASHYSVSIKFGRPDSIWVA